MPQVVDDPYIAPDGTVVQRTRITSVEEDNEARLVSRAVAALEANEAFLAAAKPGTGAAQASAAYDQAVRLTRECSALIRLLLRLLDTTSGT